MHQTGVVAALGEDGLCNVLRKTILAGDNRLALIGGLLLRFS